MNLLDEYMESDEWQQYFESNSQMLYALYLVGEYEFSKDEYIHREAMRCCLSGSNLILPNKKQVSLLRGYIQAVKFLVGVSKKDVRFKKEVIKVYGMDFVKNYAYTDTIKGVASRYYFGNITNTYNKMSRLIQYKKSKYKDALVDSGLITEQDIRLAYAIGTSPVIGSQQKVLEEAQ